MAQARGAGDVHRLSRGHLLRWAPEHLLPAGLLRGRAPGSGVQRPPRARRMALVRRGVAVMSVTTGVFGQDPADWDLRVDLSFGPPTDWQLEVWRHCIDTLPPQMLLYGTDTFWPVSPEE